MSFYLPGEDAARDDGDAWCRYFEAVHDAAVARRDDDATDSPGP